MSRRLRSPVIAVRAVIALAVAAALVVGVPFALVVLVGNPLPDAAPDWGELWFELRTGRIDAQTWIEVIAVIAWLAWANLVLSLAVETVAAIRGRRAQDRRSLSATQWLASRLVGHIALLGSVFAQATPVAAGAGLPPVAAVAAPVNEAVPVAIPVAPADAAGPDVGAAVVVGRRDTLWGLAESHLGDGERWRQLRDHNVGRTMPDGVVLDAGFTRLERGWSLALPGRAEPDRREPAVAPTEPVEVVPGDNLWNLSEERLERTADEPADAEVLGYLGEVIERNDDHIEDPDLIHPGQVFAFPEPGGGARSREPDRPERAPSTPAAAPSVPDVVASAAPAPDADARAGAAADGDSVPPVLGHALAGHEPGAHDGTNVHDRPGGGGRALGAGSPLAHVGSMTVGAAGALLASGALRTVGRRRRYRLAHRAPGTMPEPPPPELTAIERALHRHSDHESAAWLRAALGSLAARPVWPGETIGQPVTAQVRGDYLEVVFDRADEMAAPLPWATPDGGRSWHLPCTTPIDDLPAPPHGAPAPTLVTVAVDLLVNLEALGVLAVTGDVDARYDLARSIVHELANAPAAGVIDIRSTVALNGTESYGLVRYQRPDAVRAELLPWLDDVEQRRTETRATNAYAHRLIETEEPFGPVVVIMAADDAEPLAPLLRAAAPPTLPLALVVLGPADTEHVIDVDPLRAGFAGRHDLEPQLLSAPTAEALGRLLIHAEEAPPEPVVAGVELSAPPLFGREFDPGGSTPPPPADRTDRSPRSVESDRPPHDPGAGSPDVDPAPRRPEAALRAQDAAEAAQPDDDLLVRVLGPVEVEGTDAELTSQQLSIVAYLACHGPVSRAMVIDALWDGQVISQSRLPNLLTELRARLGRNHLPEAREGRYALAGVGTDLARFERGVREAQGAEPDRAALILRPLLELVRGVPFTPPGRRFWSWVADESHLAARVEALVADTALRLAVVERRLGRLERAEWACQQGLLASPTDESLVVALTEIYVEQGRGGSARRLVEGWEDTISRLDCGEPSDQPRRRLAG
ncbi:MAG: hypothetical protein AAGD35_12495 [Actinomycetota bacterium]